MFVEKNFCSLFLILPSLLLCFLLTACGQEQKSEQIRQAIAFEDIDECHLCGMAITRFAGPKGQLFEREVETSRKFCSTRDMFAYLLQPENTHRISDIYVHNMATTAWDKPNDSHLINARTAFYVINHKLTGAMGPTLAAFSQESDAKTFIKTNKGNIVGFTDITLEILAQLIVAENNKQ